MKNIYKLYLNHFILYFLGFLLITWAIELFNYSSDLMTSIILRSIVFGMLLSWTTVKRYIKELNKKGLSTDDKDLAVMINKTILSQKSSEEIYMRITQDAGLKKNKIRKTDNGFYIKTNFSWNSLGEIIEVNIENENTEDQIIKISSRPKSNLTLIDNGKNRENVEKITALIKNVA